MRLHIFLIVKLIEMRKGIFKNSRKEWKKNPHHYNPNFYVINKNYKLKKLRSIFNQCSMEINFQSVFFYITEITLFLTSHCSNSLLHIVSQWFFPHHISRFTDSLPSHHVALILCIRVFTFLWGKEKSRGEIFFNVFVNPQSLVSPFKVKWTAYITI